MAFNSNEHQLQFFSQFQARFPTKKAMVDAISRDLEIGSNAVYRRLKGDTSLSASEMLHLAKTYQLRLDYSDGADEERKAVYLPNTPRKLNSEVEFFEAINDQVDFLEGLTDVNYSLVTGELPVSLEMSLPMLRDFKMFVYGLTIWGFPKWRDKVFSPKLIDRQANKLAERYAAAASRLPGTQVLSRNMLNITLDQIIYLFEIGKLNDSDLINALFADLNQLIDSLEEMVRKRIRFLPGESPQQMSPRLTFYQNEVPTATGLLLITSLETRIQVGMTIAPSYVSTTNPEVYEQGRVWFDSLMERGTILGPGAIKQTAQFFENLRRRVQVTQEKIGRVSRGEEIFL